MRSRRYLSAWLVVPGGFLVASCGGSDSGDGTGSSNPVGPTAPVVASVNVTPDTARLPVIGDTVRYSAQARDASSGEITGKSFSWSSSDPSIASVEPGTGLVTAQATGTANITATTDEVSGSAAMIVGLTFQSVSAEFEHTCAITTGGSAYCWGRNNNGQLGDDTETPRATPVPVSGALTFHSLSAGEPAHTCGVTTTGSAHCWGVNLNGQLGVGLGMGVSRTPIQVSGDLTFQSVSAGRLYSCGITINGAAYCWGLNDNGQLGAVTGLGSPTPVLVAGGLTFQSVDAGFTHTCGVTSDDAAYCWGDNSLGEIGDGTTTDQVTPVQVSGGLTFTSVSAGFLHSCGITVGGAAYCWGSNSMGQLGDGTTTDRSTPVVVSGGLTFQSVSAGSRYNCGITTNASAYCWGFNNNGTLGDGTTIDRSTPVLVSGGLTFESVSAGFIHTCGVTTSGVAYCWGLNGNSGSLGDGTGTDSPVPVRVFGQP